MAGTNRVSFKVRKNRLPPIAKLLPEAMTVIVSDALDDGVAHAKAIVPKDTRSLERSIRKEMTGPAAGRISAGGDSEPNHVDYAGFVEFGTVFMDAQPFLGPAIEIVHDRVEERAHDLERMLA